MIRMEERCAEVQRTISALSLMPGWTMERDGSLTFTGRDYGMGTCDACGIFGPITRRQALRVERGQRICCSKTCAALLATQIRTGKYRFE